MKIDIDNIRQPLFSIIIPIYNSEKYLHRCLDSILAQTFTDYEVILIDDGSTDSSSVICNEYSKKYSRFKTYHLQNGGPSRARNTGLAKSLGGYLLFVDSDDWLESYALKIYADTIVKYNPEIIKSGYEVDYVNGHKVIHRCNKETLLNDKTQIFINTEDAGYAGFLWNSLFNRKIVGSTRFNESLKWLEDHLFSFELFARCNNLVMLPTVTYHYTINPGQSLSNVKDAQMVYDASQQEYQLKKILSVDNKKAYDLNVNSYLAKMVMVVNILYRNYSYTERKIFRKRNPIRLHLGLNDTQTRLYYSKLPFRFADILIHTYRLLKEFKSAVKRLINK